MQGVYRRAIGILAIVAILVPAFVEVSAQPSPEGWIQQARSVLEDARKALSQLEELSGKLEMRDRLYLYKIVEGVPVEAYITEAESLLGYEQGLLHALRARVAVALATARLWRDALEAEINRAQKAGVDVSEVLEEFQEIKEKLSAAESMREEGLGTEDAESLLMEKLEALTIATGRMSNAWKMLNEEILRAKVLAEQELDQAEAMLKDYDRRGLATEFSRTLLDQAKESLNSGEYSRAVELAEKAKEELIRDEESRISELEGRIEELEVEKGYGLNWLIGAGFMAFVFGVFIGRASKKGEEAEEDKVVSEEITALY